LISESQSGIKHVIVPFFQYGMTVTAVSIEKVLPQKAPKLLRKNKHILVNDIIRKNTKSRLKIPAAGIRDRVRDSLAGK
jgi:hypothetical protein